MIDVKLIRRKYNLTQQELADKCGVTLRTVQNWERGRKIPESALNLLREMFGDYETISHKDDCSENTTSQDLTALDAEKFFDVIIKQQEIMNRQINVLENQQEIMNRQIEALNKRDERIERILSMLESK